MPIYADLQLNRFYLVKENEDEEIVLVQPIMETNECFLLQHHDDLETTYWRRKDDDIAEIVEELTDEQVEEYENLFAEEEGPYFNEEEEWDEE